LWPTSGQVARIKASGLHIEKASVILKGHDSFGQVHGGHITVTGLLKQFRVDRQGGRTMLYTTECDEVGRAYIDTNTELREIMLLRAFYF